MNLYSIFYIVLISWTHQLLLVDAIFNAECKDGPVCETFDVFGLMVRKEMCCGNNNSKYCVYATSLFKSLLNCKCSVPYFGCAFYNMSDEEKKAALAEIEAANSKEATPEVATDTNIVSAVKGGSLRA